MYRYLLAFTIQTSVTNGLPFFCFYVDYKILRIGWCLAELGQEEGEEKFVNWGPLHRRLTKDSEGICISKG